MITWWSHGGHMVVTWWSHGGRMVVRVVIWWLQSQLWLVLTCDPLLGYQEMVHTWPCGCWWEDSVVLGLCKAGFHLWKMWQYLKSETSESQSQSACDSTSAGFHESFREARVWSSPSLGPSCHPNCHSGAVVPGVWCGLIPLALTAWVTRRPSSSRIFSSPSTAVGNFSPLPTWNSL